MTVMERRIARRVEVIIPFWLIPAVERGDDVLAADLENISVSGAFFTTRATLNIGARLRMVLNLGLGRPESERLLVVGVGRVIRTQPGRHNGEFGVAATVDRYYNLQPGSVALQPFEKLLAVN
jgi:hypothetical protein